MMKYQTPWQLATLLLGRTTAFEIRSWEYLFLCCAPATGIVTCRGNGMLRNFTTNAITFLHSVQPNGFYIKTCGQIKNRQQ